MPAYDDLAGILKRDHFRSRSEPCNSCDGPGLVERIKPVETDIEPAGDLAKTLLSLPPCYLDEANRRGEGLEENVQVMLVNRERAS